MADVGAGTGILSVFCVQAGAKKGNVTPALFMTSGKQNISSDILFIQII